MAEIGIDIPKQESKTLNRYLTDNSGWVITVYDDAAEACPIFPGQAPRVHWSLPNPSQAQGDEVQWLAKFRDVLDRLQRLIRDFVQERVTTNGD